MTTTYLEALNSACRALAPQAPGTRLDAEVLLASILDKPRSHLQTWPETPLTAEQLARFSALIERRAAGEPLAYLLGQREFWSLTLLVTPATLIPRPETETLVELALQRISTHQPQRIADLGTGSGAIALALARERPLSQVIATDISPAALQIARDNAAHLGISNAVFRQGDWLAPLQGELFDVIVSNPPYIRAGDPHLRLSGLPFEPPAALVAGASGMECLETIAQQARHYLRDGGWLLMEHGYEQGAAAIALLTTLGYTHISDYRDIANQPRVVVGQKVRHD